MSTSSQNKFDFPGFVVSLANFPAEQMLGVVEEEIKNISSRFPNDAMEKFRQMYYGRKLERFRVFLQTCELPADMPPREQEAYQAIASKLEAEGRQIKKAASGAPAVPMDGEVATWLVMATSV